MTDVQLDALDAIDVAIEQAQPITINVETVQNINLGNGDNSLDGRLTKIEQQLADGVGIDDKTLARIMRCVHAWEQGQDTDGDGLTDYDEYETHGTNPDSYDTDNDGVSDGDEVRLGSNPLDANSKPETPKMIDFEAAAKWGETLVITPFSDAGSYDIRKSKMSIIVTSGTNSYNAARPNRHVSIGTAEFDNVLRIIIRGATSSAANPVEITLTVDDVTLTKRYMYQNEVLTPIE